MITFVTTRLVREESVPYRKPLSAPDEIKDFAMEYLRDRDRELLMIACLDNRNKPLSFSKISEGGINGAVVDQRIIFKTALLAGASKIVLIHNHPSGECEPSALDVEATKKVCECGKILDVRVIDHLIIGDDCYFSFFENGYISA